MINPRVVAQAALRPILKVVALVVMVSTVLFFVLQLSGDPAQTLAGQNASAESIARIRESLRLDRSVLLQYASLLGGVIQLDFGSSLLNGQDALAIALESLPPTLYLALVAIGLNLLISLPLGVLLAARQESPDGWVAAAVVYVWQGIPGYVAALILVQIFALQLGWFPSLGGGSINGYVLPALALTSILVPKLLRVVQANVTVSMNEEYVVTARSIGASERSVLFRHALPNAVLGATALLGAQMTVLLSGSVTIELIFGLPGLGRLVIDSVLALDFPVVQACVFVIAVLVFAANYAVDLIIRFLDPRLRSQS